MAAIKVAIQRMFKPSAPWMIPLVCGMPLSLEAAQQADCYQSYSERDLVTAQQTCQGLAEQNDARAAFILATIYYQEGTDAGDQRGIFWDKIAAENGHAEAAYRLALAYQLGQGLEQDNTQAVRWYTQAAQAHHAKAQRSLGAMYEGGYGVKQNIQQAYAWYKRAAAQGLPDAQLRLGTMFFEGRGVKADRVQAQHWIRKSAEAGNHNAQLALGVMLAEIDPQDSARWYQRSADQGNVSAKQNLALIYFSGQGVERDLPKALALVDEAIESGNYSSQALRAEIVAELKPEGTEVAIAEPVISELVIADSTAGLDAIVEQTVNNSPVDLELTKAADASVTVAAVSEESAAFVVPDSEKNVAQNSATEASASAAQENIAAAAEKQSADNGAAGQEVVDIASSPDEPKALLALASVEVSADTLTQITESAPPAASASTVAVSAVTEDTESVKPTDNETITLAVTSVEAVNAADEESDKQLPVVTPVEPLLEKESGPYGMEADGWLMKQPAERYVIQLTNGEFREGMEKYIRRAGLKSVKGWHFYRTQRDAGLYYVLVYGEYETVAAAKKALAKLPRKARRSHWVRQYSTLQKLYRTPGSLPPAE